MLAYLTRLSRPQIALWCYLIWYLFVLLRCFEPTLSLWMNSLGISGIIGTGLYLSTAYSATGLTRLHRWQVFRLYLMPFCVSSFAALIKGRGFVLIFHPTLRDNLIALGLIAGFCGAVFALQRLLTGSRDSYVRSRN